MSRFRRANSGSKPRFSGRMVPPTPESIEANRRRDQRILDGLVQGTDRLPFGWTGGAVIPSHRQSVGPSCFYASLLAIKSGHVPREYGSVDERRIVDASAREGLMSPAGAETGREYQDRQIEFVNRILGLNIRFIDQSDLNIGLETSNALKNRKQVILGRAVPLGSTGLSHWVGLDGINRHRFGGNIGFTGMDTSNGERVEYKPEEVHNDLLKFAMPLVVVEGVQSGSRFRPAGR